jgi:hypothetical protein
MRRFAGIAKGLSLRSAAASSLDSRGPDFQKLELSKTCNLRVQAGAGAFVVSLVSKLKPAEFAPVRLEIIHGDEVVTAERWPLPRRDNLAGLVKHAAAEDYRDRVDRV